MGFFGGGGGGGGSGTVTSVSVVTANGNSGTVATATTTPAITLLGPVLVAAITLTAAQIKALLATPITIVAAPGTSKLIAPILVGVKFLWNSIAYTNDGNASARLIYGNTQSDFDNNALLPGTVNAGGAASGTSSTSVNYDNVLVSGADGRGFASVGIPPIADITIISGKALKVANATGGGATNFADGNGTLTVTVYYSILDLS